MFIPMLVQDMKMKIVQKWIKQVDIMGWFKFKCVKCKNTIFRNRNSRYYDEKKICNDCREPDNGEFREFM